MTIFAPGIAIAVNPGYHVIMSEREFETVLTVECGGCKSYYTIRIKTLIVAFSECIDCPLCNKATSRRVIKVNERVIL